MRTNEFAKPPFPYVGGKRHAAAVVWDALGDVDSYIEPFCGSAAVLIARPNPNRTGAVEIVNDLDALLANTLRALKHQPDALLDEAMWPRSEIDMAARQRALVAWRRGNNLQRLLDDPEWCDIRMAAWWLWGACAWIGDGWCASDDPDSVPRKVPGAPSGIFNPAKSPAWMRDWFRWLSWRFSRVAILCGDWRKCVTKARISSDRMTVSPDNPCGIFLDPPYDEDMHSIGYSSGTGRNLSAEAREWCVEHGSDPRLRIVLAGLEGEHNALEGIGWRKVEIRQTGIFAGGLANSAGSSDSKMRTMERLWCSPHSLAGRQLSLWPSAV